MSIVSDVLQAIGGGAGAAVSAPVQAAGGIADLIKGVIDRVSPDPQAAAAMKLQVDQLDQATHFKEIDAKLAEDAEDTKRIVAQQSTIAAEAVGKGGWLQANWHALGSLFAISLVFLIYFLLPLCQRAVPEVPESAWLMMLSVLGVAAWHSGNAKVQALKSAQGAS
jgi:hypothetical protein